MITTHTAMAEMEDGWIVITMAQTIVMLPIIAEKLMEKSHQEKQPPSENTQPSENKNAAEMTLEKTIFQEQHTKIQEDTTPHGHQIQQMVFVVIHQQIVLWKESVTQMVQTQIIQTQQTTNEQDATKEEPSGLMWTMDQLDAQKLDLTGASLEKAQANMDQQQTAETEQPSVAETTMENTT